MSPQRYVEEMSPKRVPVYRQQPQPQQQQQHPQQQQQHPQQQQQSTSSAGAGEGECSDLLRLSVGERGTVLTL